MSRSLPGDAPVYVISVAAELAGLHAQTLRQYDRLGLVTPSRTGGGGRRYSAHDVERLRRVQQMSQDGISLAGIQRILELERQVETLQARLIKLAEQVDQLEQQRGPRVFAAGPDGQIVALRPGQRPSRPAVGSALVVWRPGQR